jgi:hypothetical protein
MPLTHIDSITKKRTALPLNTIDTDHKDFKNLMIKLFTELSFTKDKDFFHLGHITGYCFFDTRARYTTLTLKNNKNVVYYHCALYLPLNKQVSLVPTTSTFLTLNNVYLNDFVDKVLNDIRELWKDTNAN